MRLRDRQGLESYLKGQRVFDYYKKIETEQVWIPPYVVDYGHSGKVTIPGRWETQRILYFYLRRKDLSQPIQPETAIRRTFRWINGQLNIQWDYGHSVGGVWVTLERRYRPWP